MRVFDLVGLFRERPLQAFGDAPFMIPGSVSPDDQDAVLTLLQQHGSGRALRQVELDLPLGLLDNGRRLLERVAASGRTHDVLIVVRGVRERRLRDAVESDPALKAFPFVAVVVPHPGGDERLGLWGELLRAVREAIHAEYVARADEFGVPPELLDVWQEFLLRLSNPCDYLQVINDIVRSEVERGKGERAQFAVQKRLLERCLRWRSSVEVLTLLGLAASRWKSAMELVSEEVFNGCRDDIQAEGLWHPDDGLVDWASFLADRDSWSDLFGPDRPLPTSVQRAEGWGVGHDDYVRNAGFRWRSPPSVNASPFLRRIEEVLQRLGDGELLEPSLLADNLSRHASVEELSPDASWRYLAMHGSLLAAQGRPGEAATYYQRALEYAQRDGESVIACFGVYVDLSNVLVESEDDVGALSVVDAALRALPPDEHDPRYRGVLLYRRGGVLRFLGRHQEARQTLAEALRVRAAGGSSLLAIAFTRMEIAWNELASDQPTIASMESDHAIADLRRIGNIEDLQSALLQRARIDLALGRIDLALSGFEAAAGHRRKTRTLTDGFLDVLRDAAAQALVIDSAAGQRLAALAQQLSVERVTYSPAP